MRRDLNNAGVAQLAEHNVANVVVEGSNPFARSLEVLLLTTPFERLRFEGFSGFGHGFRWKQLVPNVWLCLLGF